MAILLVQALEHLTEANEALGYSPRAAFIRAFTQVMMSSESDVKALARREN
jgi:AraC-like DNA-binding protein